MLKNFYKPTTAMRLIEGVGAGSPVSEEQAEADSLKDAGNSTNGDCVKRALLGDDLGYDLMPVSEFSLGSNGIGCVRMMTY